MHNFSMIVRMAFRNLWEHKVKTIIVGIIIAMGVFVLIIGNSLLDTADVGIRRSVIDIATGDLMIRAQNDEGAVSIFGNLGAAGPFGGGETKAIKGYDELAALLDERDDIAGYSPQIFGGLSSFIEEGNEQIGVVGIQAFGVDPIAHKTVFPDPYTVVEGEDLAPGKRGILLPLSLKNEYKEKLDRDLNVGDILTIQSFGGVGLKIRDIRILGFIEMNTDNPNFQFNSYADAQTIRSLTGLRTGTAANVAISDSATEFLNFDNPDDIFGDSSFEDDLFGSDDIFATEEASDETFDLEAVFAEAAARAQTENPEDSKVWLYTLVRLENSNDAPRVIAELNAQFEEMGMELEAVDWETASGIISQLSLATRTFFTIIVGILTVVAIFIIMNTLVISVKERTREIGMMRAMGAQRGFIRGVFIVETMTVSAIFGLIGTGLALLLIGILSAIGLAAPNDLLKSLLGAEIIYPTVQGMSLFSAIFLMFAIGVGSSLYPVAIALKIEPVKAMQNG